jgi:L-seryl-tRNA(Ser) seleniumtransferase
VASAGTGQVVELASVPGGGTLPGVELPSAGVRLDGDRSAELRAWRRPVIARVEGGATLLDLRTVFPSEDSEVASALSALAG